MAGGAKEIQSISKHTQRVCAGISSPDGVVPTNAANAKAMSPDDKIDVETQEKLDKIADAISNGPEFDEVGRPYARRTPGR